MNIGIVGLLPEQVRIVQQEFPAHALKFLSKDNESETVNFTKGCDKVVLMTKFIGHHIQDRVPPSKRVLLTGGITKLKSTLQKFPTPVKVTMGTKPTLPTSLAPTQKKRVNQIDWSPLNHAKTGDVIRIDRPKAMTRDAFEKRCGVQRSYAKTNHGVVSKPQRLLDGYALITVTEVRHVNGSAPATAKRPPKVDDMQIEMHRSTTAPMLTQARESAFWQSVFVETMKQWPGAPIDTIAARADEALRAYNARAAVGAAHQH